MDRGTQDGKGMKVSTQLKRYYRWKFSGPVTIICAFVIAILIWHFITENIKFFDKFTCPQMIDYYKDEHQRVDMPKYSELSVDDQKKIETERNRCVEMGWSPNIGR